MTKINKPTDDAVVISCQLIDQIKEQGGKNWADLMSLYAFYFRCGKRQKTNQPWVTNKFASKGLQWGADKLKTRKTELKKLGLIDTIRTKRKDGKIDKTYVKVSYMWGQSQTEETPDTKTTTGVISRQVAKNQQMLKVDKSKCLNLIQKEERRKGDSTNPQNPNNTCTVIQEPSDLSPNAGDVQTSEVTSSVSTSSVTVKNENKPEFLSCDKYKEVMSRRFKDICGIDGIHILNADLASNTRRINWSKQFDYWDKRLSGIDVHQTEAWKLIGKYFRVFKDTHGHYPDTRSFLKRWRAEYWKAERSKIVIFCKHHDADIVMPNYIESRAANEAEVKARWLFLATDYEEWFMQFEKE